MSWCQLLGRRLNLGVEGWRNLCSVSLARLWVLEVVEYEVHADEEVELVAIVEVVPFLYRDCRGKDSCLELT